MVYPHFSKAAQAIVNANTLSSIATLDIVPYLEVSSGSYSPISSVTGNATTYGAADMLRLTQASPSIDPNRPFVIRKLKPNQNYRIWARAYNASNALISRDSTSYVDVPVGNNDTPTMANLPVYLENVTFGASLAVDVQTDGHYDSLKATLYLVSGNSQLAIAQTHRAYPSFSFANLQGNTNYRVLVESYKLGTMLASSSLDMAITNDTAPAAGTLALKIPYVASTLAGNGTAGGADGAGAAATFNGPCGIAVDPQGYTYVADIAGHRIRKITPDGVVSTLAGSGVAGYADANGLSAQFTNPNAIALDSQNNLIVADYGASRIRKVTQAGAVTTLAGNGTAGYLDGNGVNAVLDHPCGVAVDAAGNIFFTDRSNHRIRKIDTSGNVTTFAGSTLGYKDATGVNAQFNFPHGIAIDGYGNLYVGDRSNNCVRKITPAGVVTTFAGSTTAGSADGTGTVATFNFLHGVAVDSWNNLYVADEGNLRIRKISPNAVVTTIAGNGTSGCVNGTGVATSFHPEGIVVDASGILYVADNGTHRVRKLQ